MKILLDVPDKKAKPLLKVLNGISYVKTKKLTDEKAEILSDIREAVEEMKLIKKGKLKARPIEDLINEL
ncbi:MAG: hypothetical protein KF775_06375 [Cyclobacteriaceae bacterium]|nr:hypothetical protein [Cyclobacteriaceae bacterium]